jgi:hypothetical protein
LTQIDLDALAMDVHRNVVLYQNVLVKEDSLKEEIVLFVDLAKGLIKIDNAYQPVKIIKILMQIENNVNVNLDLLKVFQLITANGVVVIIKFGTVNVFVDKIMQDMVACAFHAQQILD